MQDARHLACRDLGVTQKNLEPLENGFGGIVRRCGHFVEVQDARHPIVEHEIGEGSPDVKGKRIIFLP